MVKRVGSSGVKGGSSAKKQKDIWIILVYIHTFDFGIRLINSMNYQFVAFGAF
jgi:hypothetical protein